MPLNTISLCPYCEEFERGILPSACATQLLCRCRRGFRFEAKERTGGARRARHKRPISFVEERVARLSIFQLSIATISPAPAEGIAVCFFPIKV